MKNSTTKITGMALKTLLETRKLEASKQKITDAFNEYMVLMFSKNHDGPKRMNRKTVNKECEFMSGLIGEFASVFEDDENRFISYNLELVIDDED